MPDHDHTPGHEHALDAGAVPLLAVSVGNTRTTFCVFSGEDRDHHHAFVNDPVDALAGALAAHAEPLPAGAPAVIASVNRSVSDRLVTALQQSLGRDRVLLIGDDVPILATHTLDDDGARTVGQDRLLNAVAAYAVVKQACVVVDAGTAITVDFVDGEGVFHGGAIAPGLRMMMRSMHEGAAALPLITPERPLSVADPEAGPFGRNTPQAMLNGAYFAARGLVRILTERYAEFYEAYPQIIATGGDARLLFEGDELVESFVPDLTLRGVAASFRAWLASEQDDA